MFVINYCVVLLYFLSSISGHYVIDSSESSTLKANIARIENDRPKVGILTQEISYFLNRKFPNSYESYIAASYVKYVESVGALPIPIWFVLLA